MPFPFYGKNGDYILFFTFFVIDISVNYDLKRVKKVAIFKEIYAFINFRVYSFPNWSLGNRITQNVANK